MGSSIVTIEIEKLMAHPDNPNRMSQGNFAKLVRNIKRTGRYEPIVVRPHPQKKDCFEIINGHHRCWAMAKLGYKEADCVVWEVDDEEADILISTLNRLCGTDDLGKKLAILKRMSKRMEAGELSKILPQTKKQIQGLVNFKLPARLGQVTSGELLIVSRNPMVFFLTDEQKGVVEEALSAVEADDEKTKAIRKANALTYIAKSFLDNLRKLVKEL
jgi:ParB/RepB/Spo0J family partition protein